MRHRDRYLPLTAAALLLVCGILGGPLTRADETEPFPPYEAIRGNVEFWTRVWGEWSMGQVAVHDVAMPALVYEVADIPGTVQESYTRSQIDWVQDLREGWERRLRELEARVHAGTELNDEDKALVLQITTTAGTEAIVGAADRLRTQRGLRERFKRGLEISARYDAEFRRIFREAGLPEDLAYLPHVESSFQARARSSAGAVGIWQFTRGTGRRYMHISSAIDERLDPIAAARGAARYLAEAHEQLRSWPIALTSYNHGVGGMLRAVEQLGPDYERIFHEYKGRLFGFASKNFYAEFLAAREIARNPEAWFPEGFVPEPPFDLETVVLERNATPAAIARAYDVPLAELAGWNPAWSHRAVESSMVLPAGIPVWMTRETLARLGPDGPPEFGDEAVEGVYVVRRGDNLSRIAATHHMTVDQLRAINGFDSSDHVIHAGQKIKVVGGASAQEHVVERGETLSSIASHYRISVGELRELNDIPPRSNLIRVGQRLAVSGTGGSGRTADTVHVVARGETLSQIATRYGVKLGDLLQTNGLSLGALIHPGQHIQIPGRS